MLAHNVGTLDRVVRLFLGAALLTLFFALEGPARFVGLVGLIPLVTAFAGTCPLYSLFGIRTCPVEKNA